MDELKHTPGPWNVNKKNGRLVMSDDAKVATAERCVADPPMAWHNARLIATCPEMLRVVQRFATIDWMSESELSFWVKECRKIMEKVNHG